MRTAILQEPVKVHDANDTLKRLKKIALERNGKCLSANYKSIKQKLLWECQKGHTWFATPFSIKIRKSWCPVCAGNQPLGMTVMYKLAKKNKGKCLSTMYENCKTKMLWQCRNGHQFQSTPDNIKQGKWCPICRAARV